MLRKTLIEADSLFNKFDFETVVVYPSSEDHCCISCKTNDDLIYVFVENTIGEYDLGMFGLRDWKSMNMAISTFYKKDDDESFNIDVECDNNVNPQLLKISSKRMKLKYFVQNYAFISNQLDLKDKFDKRKFKLGTSIDENTIKLDEMLVRDICKLSAITNEQYFRITAKNNICYIVFGDEKKSVDNGSFEIGTLKGINNWKDDMYFSVPYFSGLYRGMDKDTLKMKLMPERIIMMSEKDGVIKVGALRGKTI